MNHIAAGDAYTEQAALYALGTLDADEARSFEAHLAEGCAECEAEARPFLAVAEALGIAVPEQEPPAAARDKLIARLTGDEPQETADLRARATSDEFLTVRSGEGVWREFCQGIAVKRLFVDETKGTVTSLYRLAPGAQCPPHPHAGIEQCYVVEGDCRLNDEVLGPGDFTCAMEGSFHETVHTQSGTVLLIVEQASPEMLPRS